MATVYGVNRTKANLPIGSDIIDQGVNKGNVCFMYDTYEASALALGSVIEMCDELPAGAVVTKIVVLSDNLGGSATIDLGDALDDDRYASAVDISGQAATYVYPELTAGGNIAAFGYQVVKGATAALSSNQIQILVNTSAVTGTIKVGVEYSI